MRSSFVPAVSPQECTSLIASRYRIQVGIYVIPFTESCSLSHLCLYCGSEQVEHQPRAQATLDSDVTRFTEARIANAARRPTERARAAGRDHVPAARKRKPTKPAWTMSHMSAPFGGKVMVFGGDFRQVSPVVKRGSQAQVAAACMKHAAMWPHLKQMHLTINMRIAGLTGLAAQLQTAFSSHQDR